MCYSKEIIGKVAQRWVCLRWQWFTGVKEERSCEQRLIPEVDKVSRKLYLLEDHSFLTVTQLLNTTSVTSVWFFLYILVSLSCHFIIHFLSSAINCYLMFIEADDVSRKWGKVSVTREHIAKVWRMNGIIEWERHRSGNTTVCRSLLLLSHPLLVPFPSTCTPLLFPYLSLSFNPCLYYLTAALISLSSFDFLTI